MRKRGISGAGQMMRASGKKLLAAGLIALLLALVMLPGQARAGALSAIYLNGSAGDDANDGSTAALAVKTFARAKELAAANTGIATIYVTGTVPVSGEISLSGTNAILQREASYTGTLLRVASGQTATFMDITIDGNAAEAVNIRQSLISNSGTLNIEGGAVLQNNKMGSSAYVSQGGAINSAGGIINMTGGVIQNNTATMGGGIKLSGGATLNMSGGVIQNNETFNGPDMVGFRHAGAGGGVCMIDGATFNLSGGMIQNNTAAEIGGGISIGAMEVSFGHNRMNMTGGTIDGNSSGATGGGIFIQAPLNGRDSSANISAGYITNNHMLGTGVSYYRFGGGGIYVNGFNYPGYTNGHLILTNVVITDNEAVEDGGGYAACPITNTKIYLTNGSAIFGNRADNARDVYIYANPFWGTHGGYPDYEISSTMLGGVPYHWQYPDGTEVPLTLLNGTLIGTAAEFNLETEAVANENTMALAKVFITGNTSATKGGGIGSNGDLTIGKVDDFTQLSISKTWLGDEGNEGLRPELVEVEVWRKIQGSPDAPIYLGYDRVRPDPVTGDWRLTIPLLPARDEADNLYEYSLKERDVPIYDSTLSGSAADGYAITNKLDAKTSLPVSKVWDDANNQDGVRPGSVIVKLLADNADTGKTLALSESNQWKGIFLDLDKYQNSKEVSYTVEEVPVGNGYTTLITGDAAAGFVISNSRTPETMAISGSKTWDDNNNQDGKRPASVTIRLLKNDLEIDSKTVSAAENWSWTFTNLPKYEGGKPINYAITEDAVPDYSTQVLDYNLRNTHTPGKTSVQVTKAWLDANDQDGVRPDSVTVTLLADSADTGLTLTLTEANHWTGTFTNLDMYRQGQLIVYSVEEVPVGNGYSWVTTGDAVTGYILKNSREPEKIRISGSKTWDDQDDNYGARPAAITINLYANTILQPDRSLTVVPDASGSWAWSWDDLDKYRNGKEIVYEVGETKVPDYTVEFPDYEVATLDAYDITNRYLPDHFNIPVRKFWADQDNHEGLRPESIEVKLFANGADTGKTVTLNPANHWYAAFLNLDKYDANGEAIRYRLEETAQTGLYTVIYRPVTEMTVDQLNHVDARSGATIANRRTPETLTVSGTKSWDDEGDRDGKRPEGITVRLHKNGAEIDSRTVTAADGWAWTFADLPKYEEGKLVTYTITEDSIPPYTTQVQGFDLVNRYVPPPRPTDPSYPTLRVPLVVNKALKNGSLKGGEFTFQLKDKSGQVIAEAKNAADGKVTFPDRTFSRVVTDWIYTISEVPGNDPKITYDSTVYTVKVSTRAVDGKLEATVTIQKNGVPHDGGITFTNQRQMPPTGDSMYWILGIVITAAAALLIGAYVMRTRRGKKDQ